MKKMFKKNKKGIEKLMALFWFSVLIIVSFGVFAMIYNFYHYPYDIREVEVDLLSNKIVDCLSSSGKINSRVFEEGFSDNFLEKCGITFDVEDEYGWEGNSEYYIRVIISNSTEDWLDIEKGNKNLISSYIIKKITEDVPKEDYARMIIGFDGPDVYYEKGPVEYENLAVCSEKEFISLDGDEINSIRILSIVRKTEKNIRH